MTPSKKAEQLINKYFNLPMCESVETAKYAARICVTEIIQSNPTLQGNSEDLITMIVQTKAYWSKVDEEIEKF